MGGDDDKEALVGRIILARFLERSPRSLERLVTRTDEEATMLNLGAPSNVPPPIEIAVLPGALREQATDAPSRVLARFVSAGAAPHPLYRSEAFIRAYVVSEDGFDAVLAAQAEPHRVSSLRLLARMRLINSRSRLTHAIVSGLGARQAAFVRTGEPSCLRPLTQRTLADELSKSLNDDAPAADPSRVSRVLASGSVLVAGGREVELRRLCPGSRDVHRELVREVIRCERARRVAGEIDRPLADHEIAAEVSARCEVATSRRAVAFIRKELGVANARARAERGFYLTATARFSSLRRADPTTLRAAAPSAAGVYELRVEPPGIDYPVGRSSVIYIGSSVNLRKRLLDQLDSNGRNPLLSEYLAKGRAWARWLLAPDEWRLVEREVYQHFVETFGAAPACNRMSP